ncbi:MAG: hypothetical protein Q9217_005817 [Psora testacea]
MVQRFWSTGTHFKNGYDAKWDTASQDVPISLQKHGGTADLALESSPIDINRFSDDGGEGSDSDKNARKVIIKRAPKHRLDNERQVLETVRSHASIRQVIDTIEDHPSLVLNYLDDNLLNLSGQQRVESSDLKIVARSLLQALVTLHENGYIHTGNAAPQNFEYAIFNSYRNTDIKPDNILVNHGINSTQFSEVQLGECGDTYRFSPMADPFEEGHLIGATIFWSPEAMLNLRWGPPTDIWSLGQQYVLVEQIRRFGPVPLSYEEIANEERFGVLATAIDYVNDSQIQLPFSMSEDEELAIEDREFCHENGEVGSKREANGEGAPPGLMAQVISDDFLISLARFIE